MRRRKEPKIIEFFPRWWRYTATAVGIFNVILIRKGYEMSDRTKRHELIHFAQQREMLYIFAYLFYLVEFILKFLLLWSWRKAYRSLSMEVEAYGHQDDEGYLDSRKPFAFIKYI